MVFASERLVGQALAAAMVDARAAVSATPAASPEDALALCLHLRPALLILTLNTARPAATIDLVRSIGAVCPSTTIVLATRGARPTVLRDAYDAGAAFAIPLEAAVTDLLRWCRRAITSRRRVPWELWLAAHARHEAEKRMPAGPTAPSLSPRQRQILVHLCRGMSNAAIADAIGLSEKTVRNHLTAIYATLGARRRTEAVLVALTVGLDESDPGAKASSGRATTTREHAIRVDRMPTDTNVEAGPGATPIQPIF